MRVTIQAQRIFTYNTHGINLCVINLNIQLLLLVEIEKKYALVSSLGVAQVAAMRLNTIYVNAVLHGLNGCIVDKNPTLELFEKGISIAKKYSWSNTTEEYLLEYQKSCSN
ncbi:MAG: hypothetical protein CMP53_00680 [Flavobacteriales bacterium]|nr:hypothetical protein [Flavobacteriales bacterium]|tara:strand:- start:2092 stop:2424 length:333 start_codon:yes stop_codon:yes gene_type:complete